jgi:hypothetical protein
MKPDKHILQEQLQVLTNRIDTLKAFSETKSKIIAFL